MTSTKKLSETELCKVAGGTWDDAVAYFEELCAKYGIAPTQDNNTLQALLAVCTQDEKNTLLARYYQA